MSGQDRTGYCGWCEHSEGLPESAKEDGHPCNGCWFTEDKPNWEKTNALKCREV